MLFNFSPEMLALAVAACRNQLEDIVRFQNLCYFYFCRYEPQNRICDAIEQTNMVIPVPSFF